MLDEVKAKHPKLHTIQSDVTDPAQIALLAKRVKAGYPKLDVLMNNVGITLHKNFKVPAADLDGLMAEVNINVGGVIRMTSAFIDILAGNKGTVIIRIDRLRCDESLNLRSGGTSSGRAVNRRVTH